MSSRIITNNNPKLEINLGEKYAMNQIRQIALLRIHTLFSLAKARVQEEPQLAKRYSEIARKIAVRTKLRLPQEYSHMICRNCKSFIYPGFNCRVRFQERREPHIVITCLLCDSSTRIRLKRKKTGISNRL